MADPLGTVYIELEVTCRRALSLLVEGWSDEEKAALLTGDAEAREALIAAMHSHALMSPDSVDIATVDVRMRDGEAAVDA